VKRALLTGGAGFVGANLVRRLLEEGHDVHLLLRVSSDPWRLDDIADAVRIHHVDLTDQRDVHRTLASVRPEWVFHLAAHGAYSWQTDPRQMVATNVQGTMNLMDACLAVGFDVFVNTGSSSEYGFTDHAPTEDEPAAPNSHYAVTKASATLYCRDIARRHRVQVPTLRLYSVYGPFEDPGRLIPRLILYGLRGSVPPLVSPDTARDYVYVDDVIAAYLAAACRPHEGWGPIYNVGAGQQTALREIVELASRALEVDEAPRWGSMPAREWDSATWRADIRTIQDRLGWNPRYTLAQGFERTISWMRENPTYRRRYEEATFQRPP
jgi:nucleoside-diphosphate-sugar epimerase